MRLNWFLPHLRGARPGLIRRLLSLLGPSWGWSPMRRIFQAVCLALFLGLFLYVAWPYTAQPAKIWPGWLPVHVDVESGAVTVEAESPPAEPITSGTVVHLADPSLQEDSYLGRFAVTRVQGKQLDLEPTEPLSPETLDKLATSMSLWTLSQKAPGTWPSHYADDLAGKEGLPAEFFLALDPLANVSAAVAARTPLRSLWFAGAVLLGCLVVPRAFCGYVCPLGTLIDLFDWALAGRVARFRVRTGGWWVHLKYYLLAAVLVAALFGMLLSGYLAAIPVATRAMAFVVTPIQTGLERGGHQVPPMGPGAWFSLALFLAILLLGFLSPRFWCRYACPTGAVFSMANLLRLTDRKVESSCIHCTRCVQECPFDAIKADFTTRVTDCTFCQECGGVCPSGSVQFTGRWGRADLKPANDPPTGETPLGRRGFLASALGLGCGAVGGAVGAAVTGARADSRPVVRPPGSVPEREFLRMCVRCGECYQACPNDVLQPLSWEAGLDGLWTPRVAADWSGCEPSCNNCGQVCPTGAIRPIPIEEKRVARMGLAVLNLSTCLPHAGREDCQLCVDECVASGYDAIEFVHVGTETDEDGEPVEGSGFLAPVVLAERCVGCGLCQTRCHAINVKSKRLLDESAVLVEAGPGKEDRLMRGSYLALRREEERTRRLEQQKLLDESGTGQNYLPDFLE